METVRLNEQNVCITSSRRSSSPFAKKKKKNLPYARNVKGNKIGRLTPSPLAMVLYVRLCLSAASSISKCMQRGINMNNMWYNGGDANACLFFGRNRRRQHIKYYINTYVENGGLQDRNKENKLEKVLNF